MNQLDSCDLDLFLHRHMEVMVSSAISWLLTVGDDHSWYFHVFFDET
jgi:hypothetical protein